MARATLRNLARYAGEVGWWPAMRSWTRSIAYVYWHRTTNRYRDAGAVLAGFCNHRPHAPEAGRMGGYSHWRCALGRPHTGEHRARNYVWDDQGVTRYAPIPHSQPTIQQPHDRNLTGRRASARAMYRLGEEALARRRAEAELADEAAAC